MLKSRFLIIVTALFSGVFASSAYSQSADWLQRVEYVMDIDMDAEKHQYKGSQELTYFNNSPDDLNKVFYHLYFNAFQPGSMMDVRSRSIADPDGRVKDRISGLKKDEIGYMRPTSLTQDGLDCEYQVVGTILEVELAKPIASGSSTVLEMEWDAQVPIVIRRSGRDNEEGVEFSMAQWYPKLCEYDARGWHANPYVGREFYGVWGDFDVTIHMDRDYVIGGTGYIQNPTEVGHGYGKLDKKFKKAKKLTWHFKAPKVHDFVWAADPDFVHDIRKAKSGLELHFFYQNDDEIKDSWKQFQPDVETVFDIASEKYGKYPYKQYSVIQGGDGGMEYPMATLVTGNRKYRSLLGVTVHEAMHSWYQAVLATNEAIYPWMDEGFTSYAESEILEVFFPKGDSKLIHSGALRGYHHIVSTGEEEPLCTHADHYNLNKAYGIASYNKGEVFLLQLGYIIGKEALDRTLLRYFEEWKFKHPDMWDFIRVAEKESGLELDWYLEYFVNSTRYVDYTIGDVSSEAGLTFVDLGRMGSMIMPIDVVITKFEGEQELHHIPLGIMRGAKQEEFDGVFVVEDDWFWTDRVYTLTLDFPLSEIKSIEIDPSVRLADVDRSNNLEEYQNRKPVMRSTQKQVK
ncbi:MAG: M1 family metallopeptidase [Flavobacteriales bacterium]|nr:M1 family metallopeptidase [Flavobacteriales bacterium]